MLLFRLLLCSLYPGTSATIDYGTSGSLYDGTLARIDPGTSATFITGTQMISWRKTASKVNSVLNLSNVNVGEVSNRLHVGKRSSGSNSFLKPSFQDPGAASFLHLLRRLLAAWHRPTSGRLCLLWEPQLYNPPGARLL